MCRFQLLTCVPARPLTDIQQSYLLCWEREELTWETSCLLMWVSRHNRRVIDIDMVCLRPSSPTHPVFKMPHPPWRGEGEREGGREGGREGEKCHRPPGTTCSRELKLCRELVGLHAIQWHCKHNIAKCHSQYLLTLYPYNKICSCTQWSRPLIHSGLARLVTNTNTCTYVIRVYMYVCMYECMNVCMYVCTYVCMYVRTYVCMNVCIHVSSVAM